MIVATTESCQDAGTTIMNTAEVRDGVERGWMSSGALHRVVWYILTQNVPDHTVQYPRKEPLVALRI
jgi:hypothetical protein